MQLMQFGVNSDVGILVNGVEVARTGAMATGNYMWTAKGVGMWGAAAGATKPTGLTGLQTVAPCDPIYYLSAGQTIQIVIATANLLANSLQVVGTEIDLTV